MKRITLILGVVAVMVAMLVALAAPAIAKDLVETLSLPQAITITAMAGTVRRGIEGRLLVAE